MENEDFEDFSETVEHIALTEFITKFETPMTLEFWTDLIVEEATEFLDAEEPDNVLKEYCDLAYVCTGQLVTAFMLNQTHNDVMDVMPKSALVLLDACKDRITADIDPHYTDDILEHAFKRVHESNMSKVGKDGKVKRNAAGKILKPDTYEPPKLHDLVPINAYKPAQTIYNH